MTTNTPTRTGALRKWFYNEVSATLLGAVIALGTVFLTHATYQWEEDDEAVERSIKEVDCVYDPAFIASLANILSHAYQFIENHETNKLKAVERFQKFW